MGVHFEVLDVVGGLNVSPDVLLEVLDIVMISRVCHNFQ